MSNEIAVALIALFGTLAGSAGGVLASSRLTNFRLQKLEAKVEKHNSLIERTYRLEEQMGVANHRIADKNPADIEQDQRHEEQRVG